MHIYSIQLIALWTHGRITISDDHKINIKKILPNINMIAILIGIILFITGLRLPKIINDTFTFIGSMIGPICMIVAGMLIGDMDLKKIPFYKRLYLITFLRMIAFPIVILVILKYFDAGRLVARGDISPPLPPSESSMAGRITLFFNSQPLILLRENIFSYIFPSLLL